MVEDVLRIQKEANPSGIGELEPQKLEDHIKNLNQQYPDFIFSLNTKYVPNSKYRNFKDRIAFKPTKESMLSSVLSLYHASFLERFLDLLKREMAIDDSEFIEAQIYGKFGIDDIDTIHIDDEAREVWEIIIQHTILANPELYKKILRISDKIVISNR